MGLYSDWIFPRLLDWTMASPALAAHRQDLLASLSGEVLEVGFGTGLNLPYYPDAVTRLVVVDPNPGVHEIATRRIAQTQIAVDVQVLSGETLPMPDNHYDAVVSTWTLCSIANLHQALSEIYRVLKPGGQFRFIEHGLSPEPGIGRWQDRLTPIQKCIADGCHLNRPIKALVGQYFATLRCEEFYEPGLPKIGGYFYKGMATK